MSEMFSQGEIDRIIEESWKEWEDEKKDDAISRQAALKIGDEVYIHGYIDEIRKDTIIIKNDGGYFGTVNNEIIQSAKHIRPTGHWIFEEGDGKTCFDGYVCSACNKSFHTHVPYFAEYEFCPHCGAKMVEPQESEDFNV